MSSTSPAAPAAVLPMTNPIRDYDWGSTTALAGLQGREPHGGPEAELWMGAHPSAPSSVRVGGADVPLPEFLAGSGRPPLPFLLKILAIATPLSLQVHPSAERAREMHGRPGTPYVDDAHKPEMLYALVDSEALFGFRGADRVAALLEPLDGGGRLQPLLADLTGDGDEPHRLRRALERLVTWPAAERAALVAEVAAAAEAQGVDSAEPTRSAYRWIVRLAALYPADPMVLAPALLDLRALAPGDTIFVPAGVPHAYLEGLGVEIMAASDNVLRAGLTPKPIAVEELLAVVDARPGAAPPATVSSPQPAETLWQVPVPDFRLARAEVSGTVRATDLPGPQVVLCLSGEVLVEAGGAAVPLTPGTSAFVVQDAGPLTLTGEGVVFRAAPGTTP